MIDWYDRKRWGVKLGEPSFSPVWRNEQEKTLHYHKKLGFVRRKTPFPYECPVYDIKQSDGEVPVILGLWGMRSTHSLPLLPGLFWCRVVAPDRVLSMGKLELKCVLMLNWIARNITVLTFKVCTYAKLNNLKWNCFCMPNRIVWNVTVFNIDTVLTLNSIVWNRIVLTYNCQ